MLKLEDFKSTEILENQVDINGGLWMFSVFTDTGEYIYTVDDDGSFEIDGPPVSANGER